MLSCKDVMSRGTWHHMLLEGFHKHCPWQGQASGQGQGSKQGKADVLEFGSCFNVTTPIQSHWLAYGVKFGFRNAVLRV